MSIMDIAAIEHNLMGTAFNVLQEQQHPDIETFGEVLKRHTPKGNIQCDLRGNRVNLADEAPRAIALTTDEMRKLIIKAVNDARPISRDMTNDGVRAAHTALDHFVHNFIDLMQNRHAHFSRKHMCKETKTPFNRFDR